MRPCLYFACLTILLSSTVRAEVPPRIASFVENHCLDCHSSGEDSEGAFDLGALEFELEDAELLQQWVKVFDRVREGEMPPPSASQPPPEEKAAWESELSHRLITADRQRQRKDGRGVIRRLNRSEFETALSDLLQMPLLIRGELPEDGRSHGFNTVGAALNVSSVQMEAYLNVIDKVLTEATALYEEPRRRTHRLTFLEDNNFMQVYRKTGPYLIQDDGVAIFATEKFSHLNAVIGAWTAPFKARYRIKVSAYAVRSKEPVIVSLRAGGTGHAESNHVPHVFLDHFSVEEGEPQVFHWEGWLESGHFLHVYPTSLRSMRFAGKREQFRQAEYQGPGAVIQWVEVEGPIFEQWPPSSHKALWGDLPTRRKNEVQDNINPISHLDKPPGRVAKPRLTETEPDPETGNKWVYDPKKQKVGGEPIYQNASIPKPLHWTRELVPVDVKKDSAKLLENFAQRAFRRPVSQEEIAPYVALTHRWIDEGRDFESAMRVGYKALLTSPGFLYHQGTVDNSLFLSSDSTSINTDEIATAEVDKRDSVAAYALAERTAFFLWHGLPDKELSDLAESGALRQPEVLRLQVERMLADRRSDRFIEEFLGLWLDLHLIDFTVPDEKLYPEYDKILGWSMVEETRAFLRKMLDDNLPVRNMIDSDFAMVNWRLAKHYDLAGVDGMEVRSVKLPEDSVRGGLLGQGSILKVTANGTTTSPVVRGVWLMERILGERPDPPPPGIPAIEPDIRGATTVREQLEKHRSQGSCASCHMKIDPPGVALESFDVIGGWRENYRALDPELEDQPTRYSAFDPPPIRYVEGPPVDASYVLADDRSFRDIMDFKRLLLEDERKIARNVLEKLVVYATGAEISFADRVELDRILDRTKSTQYGFRSLIHELVQSPMFLQK